MGRLTNGAQLIAEKGDVVLVMTDNQYVTWVVDEHRNTFWGHYFNDLREATTDFDNRVLTRPYGGR